MSPTRTPPMNGNEQKLLRGEGEGCHCRHAFSVQHRGDKFNTLNRCFIVDLSGARPRHWKSEVLSIRTSRNPFLRSQWTSPLSVDTKVHQFRCALALNSFRVGGAEM